MTVYVLGQITVTDPEAYKAYTAKTPDLVAAHGGKFIVRGGACHVIEGAGPPEGQRFVVIQFPSKDAFDAFYQSSGYQEILPIRLENSEGTIWLLEGVDA